MFKLSIIVPIYEEYNFEVVFNSILNQTIGFHNIEIFFVELVSTDNVNLVKEFCSKYDNVSLIRTKNYINCEDVFYTCFKRTSSDYLMFLDSTNYLVDDACELLYNEILSGEVDIVSGICGSDLNSDDSWFNILINSTNKMQYDAIELNKIINNSNSKYDSVNDCPLIIADVCISNKLFKKSFILENKIQFSKSSINDLSIFLLNSLVNARGIKFFNKIISNPLSMKNYKFSKKFLKEKLDVCYELYNFCEKDYFEIFRRHIIFNYLNKFIDYLQVKNMNVNNCLYFLEYLRPLLKSCFKNNVNSHENLSKLLEHIIKGEYEDALMFIYGIDIPKQNKIKIATIADQFTYNSFKYEYDLIYIYPDNWMNQFEQESPDLFLCESAFYGPQTEEYPDGVWSYKIHTNLDDDNENRKELFEILKYCKQSNIPTIFWNKEDPTSFNKRERNFVDTALNFDYIFTSSEECVPQYNKKGHQNVYSLMFAVQPRLFNPISPPERLDDTVIFAGSWYGTYPERCRNMEIIFDKVLDKGYKLKIYDRVSFRDWLNFKFPDKYQSYLNDCVDYSEMPRVYKESEIGININTVTGSNTMFARRIFELMASNTLVFSNFSKGIYNLFKDNVFYLDNDKLDFEGKDLEKIKKENLYTVLRNHTYSKRLREILDGINFKYVPDLRHIVIFYKLDDLSDLDKIYNNFFSISYPYKHLKLVTTEDKLFIPDTVLKEELNEIMMCDNYFFCFADLNLDPDFIGNALIHYDYIDCDIGIMNRNLNKYSFDKIDNFTNVVFNHIKYDHVLADKSNFDVYII